jgi:hypothetical protein
MKKLASYKRCLDSDNIEKGANGLQAPYPFGLRGIPLFLKLASYKRCLDSDNIEKGANGLQAPYPFRATKD